MGVMLSGYHLGVARYAGRALAFGQAAGASCRPMGASIPDAGG